MFRSIMLVGALAATFMLAVVSCDTSVEPPTSPPAAPTEPPTPTLSPVPQYLDEIIPPCEAVPGILADPCEPPSVSASSYSMDVGDYISIPDGVTPESIAVYLEGWSEDTIPHIVLRGTFLPNTVRCDAGYTYNQPAYLGPEHGGIETGYTLEDSTILHCFADVRVSEYIVGSGPPMLTLEITHDLFLPTRGGQAALTAFESLWERVLIEGGAAIPAGVATSALGPGTSDYLLQWASILGNEAILFVGPLFNKNVEAWKYINQWNVIRKDDDTVVAVHPEWYGRTPEDRQQFASQLEMTLPAFRQAVSAAHTARVTANEGRTQPNPEYPMFVTNANNLTQFFREIGSYDDPANPPQRPPAAYECDNTTAVTSPGVNRGLVQDCESLLDSKDTLRGTASLNWSASITITTWDGVTVTDDRITKLELDDESLTGIIPPALGDLSALTHLDLSGNSLTGNIPRELVNLENLQVLRLSGNSLTGCIPEGLKDVATNDLNSLNLQDCPPAPSNPSVGTPGEASVPLTWNAVPNAAKYRVEYRVGSRGEWALDYRDGWTVAAEVPTGTSYTVTGLVCKTDYRVRVRAYGNGSTYAAAWGPPSPVLATPAGACVPPTFGAASYAFAIVHDSEVGTAVGSVSATGSKGADDTVTYAITEGNEDGTFALDESTGEITAAVSLTGLAGTTLTMTVEAEDESGGAATVTMPVRVTLNGSVCLQRIPIL